MSLEMNKVAAAVLVAGLVGMISGKVADGLYHGGEPAEKRGFEVAVVEDAGSAGGAPAAEEAPVDIAPFLASADLALGEATFKKCTSCHTAGKGEPHKVGPNLAGIVGGPHAHAGDYAYSDAMKAKHGETWTPQALSEFLTNPKKAVPGTKMAFAGIKKPEERAALIKFLEQHK